LNHFDWPINSKKEKKKKLLKLPKIEVSIRRCNASPLAKPHGKKSVTLLRTHEELGEHVGTHRNTKIK
jgi:hypothetical protein